MTASELRTQVEQLIIANELDDAIRILLGVVTARRELSRFREDAILLLSEHSRLRKDQRNGILSVERASMVAQALKRSTLDLLQEVERGAEAFPGIHGPDMVEIAIPQEVRLEKIIGAVSHLKSIAWLTRGAQAARSVCRILTPDSFGTGFVVNGGRVMTNYHVLPSRDVARTSRVEFNFQETLEGGLEPSKVYDIDSDSWAGDTTYDCATVRLQQFGDEALRQWGYLAVEAAAVPEVNAHVSIIQHPNGGPKQIAVTANQVVSVFGHRLHYTTDTLAGSSGSPVFNDDWKVVALHHAGGHLRVNGAGEKRYVNEGILMSYLGHLL
jgi:endonuclease G